MAFEKQGHTVKGCQGVNITIETHLLDFPLASAGMFTQADSEVLYHEQPCVKGKVPEDTKETESTEHCGQQFLGLPLTACLVGLPFLALLPMCVVCQSPLLELQCLQDTRWSRQ